METNDNLIAYNALRNRGVTRLCHFTKTKNLVHILTSEDGILATELITSDIKEQNDPNRFDGATDCVCCSIQYPNGWYWEKAKQRDTDKIFKDWVVITINLSILKENEFQFCPCNAAVNSGAYIRDDITNVTDMFGVPTIKMKFRPERMLSCCPTDDQSEILVRKNIPLRYITGIIVGGEENADNIVAILKTIGQNIPVFISASVCNAEWSRQVRNGQRPTEAKYNFRGELV